MGRLIYFCPVVSSIFFLYLSFFPRLISAVAGGMSTILLQCRNAPYYPKKQKQDPTNHEFSLKLQISVMVSIAVSNMGMTELIFVDPGMKVVPEWKSTASITAMFYSLRRCCQWSSMLQAIRFYSARNARIASAVLATAIPSVCLSVRHTPVLCIVQFAPLDSKMCLIL